MKAFWTYVPFLNWVERNLGPDRNSVGSNRITSGGGKYLSEGHESTIYEMAFMESGFGLRSFGPFGREIRGRVSRASQMASLTLAPEVYPKVYT